MPRMIRKAWYSQTLTYENDTIARGQQGTVVEQIFSTRTDHNLLSSIFLIFFNGKSFTTNIFSHNFEKFDRKKLQLRKPIQQTINGEMVCTKLKIFWPRRFSALRQQPIDDEFRVVWK